MPAIIPIPTNRVSGQLIQQRLLNQLQVDNLDLLRLQDQLSSGQRITAPSEDARVSLRAIRVQRLLEQKDQFSVNVSTSQAYLGASETSLTSVGDLLLDIRGLAITAADTTTSDIEREAASVEILRAVQRVADIGNQKFRGRYLFSGNKTGLRPFDIAGKHVIYSGDDGQLESLVDIDLLTRSNISGEEAFGAVSAGVQSNADLNPITTENTRLSDLRHGLGITHFSFVVSDGVSAKTIDISQAETLGDVVRLIEAAPPTGRQVTARITPTGLTVALDPEGGGNLFITEVSGGSAASQLGILSAVDDGLTVVGNDLDPRIRLTSELDALLGARSQAVVRSTGDNNDIFVEARQRGDAFNNYALQFVDDDLLQAADGLLAGGERVEVSDTIRSAQASLKLSGSNDDLILIANVAGTSFNNVSIELDSSLPLGDAAQVDFDAQNRKLTINIDSGGATTLSTLVGAINSQGTFTAIPDNSDGEGFSPSDTVNPADAGVVLGNTGNSGGAANTIYVYVEPGKTRANDVVKILQLTPDFSDLFDVRIDGKDTVLQVEKGNGVIDVNATGLTSLGGGTEFDQASGLQITNGGESHVINLQGAETVEDLLNRLNGSSANVIARINSNGTGIDVHSKLSGADFAIGENGGTTATELGLRTLNGSTFLHELNRGVGVQTISGTDFTITRNDGTILEVDVSFAETVADVIDIINNHPDNQDAKAITARLALFGNGIELVDDNPESGGTLTIRKTQLSQAAWHLGLIPLGQSESYPANTPPVAATAQVQFPTPNDVNTAFVITATVPGSDLNGVDVEFINSNASGDQALVEYDETTKRLRIDVDPTATTANTVIAAINDQGLFSANVDPSDPGNDGTGLIQNTGILATTNGGVPSPTAQPASAAISFDPPLDVNTAFKVTSIDLGTQQNGIEILFQSGAVTGNAAIVNYDDVARQLRIDIDPSQTTANAVVNAIIAEGTFTAELDLSDDPTNDGTGVIGILGTVGTTDGGTPEVFTGADVAPLETNGIFNSLIRLQQGIDKFNIAEIERSIVLLDDAIDQLNFVRADLGAREQALDSVSRRIQDDNIQLREALSEDLDTDFVATISNLTARQAALEASLRLVGRTLQLSLLEFI